MKLPLLILCICFVPGFCQKNEPDDRKSILFVGNSLTYENNLPKLVIDLGKKHDVKISTKMLAYPNYALEDHWNDGKLQELIRSRKFDFVVVQQGPSSKALGKRMLLDYGKKIKALCDENEMQLAFYMVWPSMFSYHTYEKVIQHYEEAAKQTRALLCPVGKVWKEHFDQHNDFSYYGQDGFHPSLKGSSIAARVIFDSLKLKDSR